MRNATDYRQDAKFLFVSRIARGDAEKNCKGDSSVFLGALGGESFPFQL